MDPSSLCDADLHAPAVDAVMAVAASVSGAEGVFLGGFDADDYEFLRIIGATPGFVEGGRQPRATWLCEAMLAGATPACSDCRVDPGYAGLPVVTDLGVTSYVGVPVHRAGEVAGTLCGVDRTSVPLPDDILPVMTALAGVLESALAVDEGPVVRRTADGWHVGAGECLDITSAMSLADLLAEDFPAHPRPHRPGDDQGSEAERLRLAVRQLEHALTARVTVEQAIGILCERHHLGPRDAFDRMRKAARTRGRRIHQLAREVVASAGDPSVPLPPELAPRP